jgi:rhodanese-related sulfurtransferase
MWLRRNSIPNLTPAEVHDRLACGAITLIDVREPDEWAAEAVAGAHLVPLSRLDPASLPGVPGRPVVFLCQVGRRSAAAAARCAAAGVADCANLEGGLNAWKAAGLPTAPGGGSQRA